VAVPIFIMYRKIGLGDTHLGMNMPLLFC